MPRLSVLMPVFNAQETLKQSLTSTLRALPRDSELIVFDDGSSDGSPEQLARLKDIDSRVRVITSPINVGVSAGLQALFEAADSEFVARMDADDLTIPWRFRQQQAHLAARSLDVTFSTVIGFTPGTRSVRPQNPTGISAEASSFHLLLGNPFVHSTMFARRATLEQAGGYRNVPSEDYDLWLRLAWNGARLARQAGPTVLYRHHPSQVTANADWILESHSNPETARAHQALAKQVLGSDEPMFSAIRSSKTGHRATGLAEFVRAIRVHAADLPTRERHKISRAIRRIFDSSDPSPDVVAAS